MQNNDWQELTSRRIELGFMQTKTYFYSEKLLDAKNWGKYDQKWCLTV